MPRAPALLAAALVPALLSPPPLAAAPALDGPIVVVLDPGHGGEGGRREGARNERGLLEKTVALNVALRLKTLLEQGGATVVLTREEDADVPLAARAQLANEVSADLFLSIHCNSMKTRRGRERSRGIETYFLSLEPTDAEARLLAELENGGPEAAVLPRAADPVAGLLNDLALSQARNDSAELARIVHRHLVSATQAPSRGVRQAPFVVLAGTKMPAVLVEIGFISHAVEGALLGAEPYQGRIASALAAAIRDFADHVLAPRLFAMAPGEKAERAAAHAAAARAPTVTGASLAPSSPPAPTPVATSPPTR